MVIYFTWAHAGVWKTFSPVENMIAYLFSNTQKNSHQNFENFENWEWKPQNVLKWEMHFLTIFFLKMRMWSIFISKWEFQLAIRFGSVQTSQSDRSEGVKSKKKMGAQHTPQYHFRGCSNIVSHYFGTALTTVIYLNCPLVIF